MIAVEDNVTVSLLYQEPVVSRKRKTSSGDSAASKNRMKKIRMETDVLPLDHEKEVPSEWDHYPAELNTFITERFFVLKQAGMGAFATVWMCWDIQDLRFVALKISRSDKIGHNCAKKEKAVFDRLHEMKAISGHVIECLGSLKLEHEDRKYLCLVFEMMGGDLLHKIEENQGLPASQVQQVLTDVLSGLHTLHSCGIAHTDIKPENVLVSLSEEAEEGLALQAIEAFKKMPEVKHHIRPLKKHIRALAKRKLVVKLADLGSAQFMDDQYCAPVITTAHYRSFEAVMGGSWTTKTDIWSVGCMAFELATGRMLMPVADDQESLLLNWMISRLGMPPPQLRYNREHFDRKGGRRDSTPIQKRGIQPEKIVKSSKKRFDLVIAEPFVHLVKSMLEFDQDLRPTAVKCLEHPFITELLVG